MLLSLVLLVAVGDTILVRVGGTDDAPDVRPALVTRVLSESCVNAQLFLDGGNDDALPAQFTRGQTYLERGDAPTWLTSVIQGTGIGQWQLPAIPADMLAGETVEGVEGGNRLVHLREVPAADPSS